MSDDYQDAAGIPVSRPAEITYLLRCLSDDCEWRAFEVEEYIKQLEADRDTLAAEVRAWREANAAAKDRTGKLAIDLINDDWSISKVGAALNRTVSSGALTRAKEAK